MLYIVRGLPGSGKSTFAKSLSRALNCPHFEEDMWLFTKGHYYWTPERFEIAVETCLRETELAMLNYNVNAIVVSNVFETEDMLEPYATLAKKHDWPVTYLVAENRRGGVNIHNVPDEALDQMKAEFQVRL